MYGQHQSRRAGTIKGSSARQRTAAERKKATARLRYLSHYDALTGLPNRAFFRYEFRKALRIAEYGNQPLAILFLSIDPYERINETLGPAMGDRLIRGTAKRLKSIMRSDHAVGYWGGNEFVVLLRHPKDEAQVVKAVRNIKKTVERKFTSNNQECLINSSVGIGLYPLHGLNVETLLKNAGTALLRAKEGGGNGYRFYTADMNARSLKRLTLENMLRQGLRREEFTLHYQPQFEGDRWEIIGAEALIRWAHPEVGLIPPAEFIPLAEESGLIVPIGEWVLRSACLELKQLHANGFPNLKLAVNISARQFEEHAPAEMIVGILEETRLSPGCLELELTESSLMANADHVVKSLSKLKDAGVKLAIDDFGTGFSSLECLRRLPLDTLKIDQSFVKDAMMRLDGAALLSTIITLAHRLRLKAIAEGVETQEQLALLQRLGCDGVQGYLFSRPLPSEQFKGILACANYQFGESNSFIEKFSPRTRRALL